MKVILDCDITMGLPGKDVDDGLALMALLGRPEVELLGVTSTFGNSTIEEVHPTLLRVLQELGHQEIPAFPGADSPEGRDSAAAAFLAQAAAANPGQVALLATGSTTNLAGAADRDPQFFHNLARMVFMGGVTRPLRIDGREMAELNFSADAEAAHRALSSGCRATVVTGNLCLQAPLAREHLDEFFRQCSPPLALYLEHTLRAWLGWMEQKLGVSRLYPWDAVAALCLVEPDLFVHHPMSLGSTPVDLAEGLLRPGSGTEVDVPERITDPERLRSLLFTAWEGAGRRL